MARLSGGALPRCQRERFRMDSSSVFRTAAPQPGPPLPRRIFIELALVTVLLALRVVLHDAQYHAATVQSRAAPRRPSGRGVRHAPLVERGAREVRDATRAFNTMQERLQRYLDSRTRVLAAMSHDLRTPLHASAVAGGDHREPGPARALHGRSRGNERHGPGRAQPVSRPQRR